MGDWYGSDPRFVNPERTAATSAVKCPMADEALSVLAEAERELLAAAAATDRATKQFAETHRLHVRRDECNDQIIPGRRGHLYFDGDFLCLMAIDGLCAEQKRWEACGGNLWLGSKSMSAKGRNVQDVKIVGVTNPKAAIRMCGIKTIRQMSQAQSEALAKAREKLPEPFRQRNVRP